MFEGTYVARFFEGFGGNHKLKSDVTSEEHHESKSSFCNRFLTHNSAVVKVFQGHHSTFEYTVLSTVNSSIIEHPEEDVRSAMSSNVIDKSQFDKCRKPLGTNKGISP